MATSWVVKTMPLSITSTSPGRRRIPGEQISSSPARYTKALRQISGFSFSCCIRSSFPTTSSLYISERILILAGKTSSFIGGKALRSSSASESFNGKCSRTTTPPSSACSSKESCSHRSKSGSAYGVSELRANSRVSASSGRWYSILWGAVAGGVHVSMVPGFTLLKADKSFSQS